MATKRVLKLYRLDDAANIDSIVRNATGYQEQPLADGINARVLYQENKASTPTWKGFFTDVVIPNSDLFQEEQSNSESFVCLLNASTGTWYAITGGYGHHEITAHIEKNFGTDILVRIISETDQSLLAASEKSVTGGKIASSIHYRRTSRFYEYKGFGSITNTVNAEVSEEQLLNAFPSIAGDEISKIRVVAGSSLQLKTSINFLELVSLIEDCEVILDEDPNFLVNSIIPIKRSSNEVLIRELENKLKDQFFELYQKAEDAFPFDICHNDFDKYLGSSTVKLLRKTSYTLPSGEIKRGFVDFLQKRGDKVIERDATELPEVRFGEELFDLMRLHKGTAKNANVLWGQLKTLHIKSFSPAGGELTSGTFLSHVMGDVSLPNGSKYFLVDNQWYQLENEFLERLDKDCASVILNQSSDLNLLPWPDGTEAQYNESYIGREKFLCVDRLLYENVEICDLISWDDNSLHLIHVKKGFGNTLRELCNQLLVSTSLLNSALESTQRDDFLNLLYERFANNNGQEEYFRKARVQFENFGIDDFKALFDKRINVTLAIKDTAQAERNIATELERFRSTIGKFSLVDLNQKMGMNPYRLGITQIFRG